MINIGALKEPIPEPLTMEDAMKHLKDAIDSRDYAEMDKWQRCISSFQKFYSECQRQAFEVMHMIRIENMIHDGLCDKSQRDKGGNIACPR